MEKELAAALEGILSLGRKDTSNPKYDGYYTEAKEVLELYSENEKKTLEAVDQTPGKSVLQDWVTHLPLMQQALLLAALRGPDGISKFCDAKPVVRFLRGAVLMPADPLYKGNTDDFMWNDFHVEGPHDIATEFQWSCSIMLRDVDIYPHHFLMHLIHAAQVIGYKHPEIRTAQLWESFYRTCCSQLHVVPETEQQMDRRLDR